MILFPPLETMYGGGGHLTACGHDEVRHNEQLEAMDGGQDEVRDNDQIEAMDDEGSHCGSTQQHYVVTPARHRHYTVTVVQKHFAVEELSYRYGHAYCGPARPRAS